MSRKQYVFGYGSLVHPHSRKRTLAAELGIEAELHGFQIGWFACNIPEQATPISITPQEGAKVNGFLFEVHEGESPQLCAREIGYVKTFITPEQISTSLPVDGDMFTYAIEEAVCPPKNRPIVQSYVDVVIAGYLQHSIEHAKRFIESANCWGEAWVNDRENPIFPRGISDAPIALIDDLLEDIIHLRQELTSE